MKVYSTPVTNTTYNRNNMVGFFKKYQQACLERNAYYEETQKLSSIHNLSYEEPFTDVKDTIVVWLSDMAKAGLIDAKDSDTVDKLLTNAYDKLNSKNIDSKLEDLDYGIKQQLNHLQKAFDEVPENTGYLTKVLDINILGLTLDKVEIVNKILDRKDVHVSNTYYTNGSNERGNFDVKIYADNLSVLEDIKDEITMASLKSNFKGNVKKSHILDEEEAFKLMTNLNNDVFIGTHINRIITKNDVRWIGNNKSSKLKP